MYSFVSDSIQNEAEYYVYVGRWTECIDYEPRVNRYGTMKSITLQILYSSFIILKGTFQNIIFHYLSK